VNAGVEVGEVKQLEPVEPGWEIGKHECATVVWGSGRSWKPYSRAMRTSDGSRSRSLSRRRFCPCDLRVRRARAVAAVDVRHLERYRSPGHRRTLVFPDLPPGLDGLKLLHLSDLHAGIHLGEDTMQEIVGAANALRPDLIVQTGDMIDISRAYIPPYVRAFRELSAPLGVVTVLGNHDRYTGEREVIQGCRDAGQVFVQNGCHVVERHGAVLALLGIDDPHTGARTIRSGPMWTRPSAPRRRTRFTCCWPIVPERGTRPPRAVSR